MKLKKKFKKIKKRYHKPQRQLDHKFHLKQESLVKIEKKIGRKTRQFNKKK